MLFQLELNRQADADICARDIHDWLLVNHGTPRVTGTPRVRRRVVTDVGGTPKLGP
jgi:hypothetical protein